jgi:hypothetical protein
MRSPTTATPYVDACDAQNGEAVIADQPAPKADQDRREGRQARQLHHVPNGRVRGVAVDVQGNPDPHRRAAGATHQHGGLLPARGVIFRTPKIGEGRRRAGGRYACI